MNSPTRPLPFEPDSKAYWQDKAETFWDKLEEARQKIEVLRDQMDEERKRLYDRNEREVVRLETDLAVERSRHSAVLSMRPLFEYGLVKMKTSPKDSLTSVQEKRFVPLLVQNDSLTPEAKAWLQQLEGQIDERDVVRRIKNLYGELSEKLHYKNQSNLPHGLICGGEMPLRAAVAIALLKMQKDGLLESHIEFVYADDSYVERKKLIGGQVV